MKEKDVEQYLVRQVERLNGIPYKFKSPQRRSVPDRLCVFPKGIAAFVECKALDQIPTEAQYRELDRLTDRDHWAFYIDRISEIDKFIRKVLQMM